MVVISKAILREFAKKHPDAEDAILKWYETTKIAEWKNFTEVKKHSTR